MDSLFQGRQDLYDRSLQTPVGKKYTKVWYSTCHGFGGMLITKNIFSDFWLKVSLPDLNFALNQETSVILI